MTDDTLIYANGIAASTSTYALPPFAMSAMAEALTSSTIDRNEEKQIRTYMRSKASLGTTTLSASLAEAGWGVIFPAISDPRIHEALAPLLDRRRTQAGPLFRDCFGGAGYRPGEQAAAFLARQGVKLGPPDSARFPHFLLLIGSPTDIPFAFQSQLDLFYAVGRLSLSTPEEYHSYVQRVLAAETGALTQERRISFFGPHYPNDPVSTSAVEGLLRPLSKQFEPAAAPEGWQRSELIGPDATKAGLLTALAEQPPAIFVAITQTVLSDQASPPTSAVHGALLCQDWPGPTAAQPLEAGHYLAAADITTTPLPQGALMVLLGSLSVGSPTANDLALPLRHDLPPLSTGFDAALAQRLLARSDGPLAVLGLTNFLWSWSGHTWDDGMGDYTDTVATVLTEMLRRTCAGERLGAVMDTANSFYVTRTAVLLDELENIKFGKSADPNELARLWAFSGAVRALTLLGDPALRLPAAAPPELLNMGGQVSYNDLPTQVSQQTTNAPPPLPTLPQAQHDDTGAGVLGGGDPSATAGSTTDDAGVSFSVPALETGTSAPTAAPPASPLLGGLAERLVTLSERLLDSRPISVSTGVAASDPAVLVPMISSQISLDGAISTTLPPEPAADEAILRLHADLVRAALEQRARSIEALGRVLSELQRYK